MIVFLAKKHVILARARKAQNQQKCLEREIAEIKDKSEENQEYDTFQG